jgi:hypothetical protein
VFNISHLIKRLEKKKSTVLNEFTFVKSSTVVMHSGVVFSMRLTGDGFLCNKASGLIDIEILIIRFEHAFDSVLDM